jgi:hypothetical protein
VYDDILNTNTPACLARIPTFIPVHNAIVYTMHTYPTTTYSCEQAMHCTHLSVWSVELWASAAAMCCTPSAPMELSSRLHAHVCESRTIQCTCVADECAIPYIQTSARSCTPMHTCVSTYTYTYLHSSAQSNSIYHAHTCPTTTHSCEQAMYCTHVSVWSVKLWASAAAMCCAPFAPMELYSRLHAHVSE